MGEMDGELHFNLVDEPWIEATSAEGATGLYSLREILHQADRIRELSGELPTIPPPIFRLLLAITYRALEGPTDKHEWAALWNAGGPRENDRARFDLYLERYHDRFDLFHPEKPFMQVPGLKSVSGDTKSPALLKPQIANGNNVPMFIPITDDDPQALTAAQAARWLLHAHAWDTAGIKTGVEGDPKAKGGRLYGNHVGHLGGIGYLAPMGGNLWESMVLNLVPFTETGLLLHDPDRDKPPWELDPPTAAWEERPPRGPVDLLTFNARHMRLIPSGSPGEVEVHQLVLSGGDRLSALQDLFRREPHTAWRRSKNYEKKLGREPVYLAQGHRADRLIWRGLTSLLGAATGASTMGKASPHQIGSHTLAWLGAVRDMGLADVPRLVDLTVVGLEYGTQNAVVNQLIADRLPLPVQTIVTNADEPPEAYGLVSQAIESAEDAASLLASLTRNVLEASGETSPDALKEHSGEARERLYHHIDHRFRHFLTEVAEETADIGDWRDEVRKVTESLAEDVIASAPPDAFAGRERENGQLVNLGRAELFFRRGLYQKFPLRNRPTQERAS